MALPHQARFQAEQGIEHMAAAEVRPRPAKMAEQVTVRTVGVFKGVGEDGEPCGIKRAGGQLALAHVEKRMPVGEPIWICAAGPVDTVREHAPGRYLDDAQYALLRTVRGEPVGDVSTVR